jgi:cytochrome c oxidase subunit 3
VTEVLFFSGLFVAYAVYRSNHPEVFVYAHQFLNKSLGALNTIVLLCSSLTMAWAVRCAQLNQQRGLKWCLATTLALAGFFLGVKSVEYSTKWNEGLLWAGDFKPVIDHAAFIFSPALLVLGIPALISLLVGGVGVLLLRQRAQLPLSVLSATVVATSLAFLAGAGAATMITSAQSHETHAAAAPHAATLASVGPSHLAATEEVAPPRLAGVFFSIYYAMTGVHAIHILAGMGVIGWLLFRSVRGDFGSDHFGPVDYVGLYWHLVDLVWIYLFPLLYLIH